MAKNTDTVNCRPTALAISSISQNGADLPFTSHQINVLTFLDISHFPVIVCRTIVLI
jgi:hypothetical protein